MPILPERKKPPADWQMQRANKLGIQLSSDISHQQLEELLNKAEFDKPPTYQQLKKAKEFGVSITPNLTYGQLGSLLDEAEWAQPANAEQTELCERQEKGSGLFFERDLVSSLGTES